MDIKEIRRLLKDGHSVVLVEEGYSPLVVTELAPTPRLRTVTEQPPVRTGIEMKDRQDQVLDRLNKEILALKAQIAQDEEPS